jgi:hypothetical protein
MSVGVRGITSTAIVLVLGLTACGSSRHTTSATSPAEKIPSAVPVSTVVVQVGKTSITRSQYEHWMRIGDATVAMPLPGHPLPTPVDYEPPDFTACVAHLRATSLLHESTSQLTAKCRHTYVGIKTRILGFLINGYWLREEAAEKGESVSGAEVQKEFNNIKQREFPTAAALQRLLAASRQTTSDLKFAVETEMLSAKLLKNFSKPETQASPESAVEVLNKALDKKWMARTTCKPGYVIAACSPSH